MDAELQRFTVVFRERDEAATYRARPEIVEQITLDFKLGRTGGAYPVFDGDQPRQLALRFELVLYIG